jgi:cell shape-determining protein MreD
MDILLTIYLTGCFILLVEGVQFATTVGGEIGKNFRESPYIAALSALVTAAVWPIVWLPLSLNAIYRASKEK